MVSDKYRGQPACSRPFYHLRALRGGRDTKVSAKDRIWGGGVTVPSARRTGEAAPESRKDEKTRKPTKSTYMPITLPRRGAACHTNRTSPRGAPRQGGTIPILQMQERRLRDSHRDSPQRPERRLLRGTHLPEQAQAPPGIACHSRGRQSSPTAPSPQPLLVLRTSHCSKSGPKPTQQAALSPPKQPRELVLGGSKRYSLPSSCPHGGLALKEPRAQRCRVPSSPPPVHASAQHLWHLHWLDQVGPTGGITVAKFQPGA